MLGKGIVKEGANSKWEYWVDDLFSSEILLLKVAGKQVLYHPDFQPGDEVYFIRSPYKEGTCIWCTPGDFKMNQDLYAAKLELDRKHQGLSTDEE